MLLRTTMHPRRLGQSARFHPAMASRLSRGARARASNSEPEGRGRAAGSHCRPLNKEQEFLVPLFLEASRPMHKQ